MGSALALWEGIDTTRSRSGSRNPKQRTFKARNGLERASCESGEYGGVRYCRSVHCHMARHMAHRFGNPSFFRPPFVREIVGYIGLHTSGYRRSLLLRTESRYLLFL